MWEKYKQILSSPRAHQLIAAAILQILQHYGVIDSFVANIISGLLGASVVVGSADSVATKMKK